MEQLIKKILSEMFEKNSKTYADFIRKTLQKIYEPKNMWGSINDPEKGCVTGVGVIGGNYEHIPGIDKWSILNRFDTNYSVAKKIREIYSQENPGSEPSERDIMEWIGIGDLNPIAYELFDEGGKYLEELVNINKGIIERGNDNEEFAMDALRLHLGLKETQLRRYCSGSIEDTKKGQDIAFQINNQWYTMQVKTVKTIKSRIDEYGETYYEVSPVDFDKQRYAMKNVNFLFFIAGPDYVMFQNIHQRMNKIHSTLRFYEPTFIDNLGEKDVEPSSVDKKSKQIAKELGITDKRRKIKDLEYKKAQIEKLIQKIKSETDVD